MKIRRINEASDYGWEINAENERERAHTGSLGIEIEKQDYWDPWYEDDIDETNYTLCLSHAIQTQFKGAPKELIRDALGKVTDGRVRIDLFLKAFGKDFDTMTDSEIKTFIKSLFKKYNVSDAYYDQSFDKKFIKNEACHNVGLSKQSITEAVNLDTIIDGDKLSWYQLHYDIMKRFLGHNAMYKVHQIADWVESLELSPVPHTRNEFYLDVEAPEKDRKERLEEICLFINSYDKKAQLDAEEWANIENNSYDLTYETNFADYHLERNSEDSYRIIIVFNLD